LINPKSNHSAGDTVLDYYVPDYGPEPLSIKKERLGLAFANRSFLKM